MNTQRNTKPFEVLENHLMSIKCELEDIRKEMASQTRSEKTWYTIQEAAAKLNVNEFTLYRNSKSGLIPTKRIGARLMVPGSFVDK